MSFRTQAANQSFVTMEERKMFQLKEDEEIIDYIIGARKLSTAFNVGEPIGPLPLCLLILDGFPPEHETYKIIHQSLVIVNADTANYSFR
jgi:hypothetical protein